MADLPSWHPSREVLEFAELVLARALPHVPVPLDVPADLAVAARSAGGLVLEDAEGTPVATLTGDPATGPVTMDRLCPGRPFTHGPLRARRRPPVPPVGHVLPVPPVGPEGLEPDAAGLAESGEVDVQGAPGKAVEGPGAAQPVLAVAVTGPLTVRAVEAVAVEAVRGGFRLLWLVVVGAGRRCALSPEGLLRAVSGAAAEADARGAAGDVVVAGVPRSAGLDDVALLADVGLGYGAAEVLVLPPVPSGPTGTGGTDISGTDVAGETDVAGGAHLTGGTGRAGEDWHPASRWELERSRRAPHRRGVTVFLTGLSGSGKSTIARGLAERLLDDGRREISLLDGDEVRRLLSHGLGFSRADRDLNIRRIGFVAAEITRHGGLAICAPIAPFEQVRREVRERVEEVGDFVLVHVSTPLAECERRDRKGLYARARQGLVAEFTGISSPYEAPEDADLRVDTTGIGVDEAVDRVWQLLLSRDYLGPVDPAGPR